MQVDKHKQCNHSCCLSSGEWRGTLYSIAWNTHVVLSNLEYALCTADCTSIRVAKEKVQVYKFFAKLHWELKEEENNDNV